MGGLGRGNMYMGDGWLVDTVGEVVCWGAVVGQLKVAWSGLGRRASISLGRPRAEISSWAFPGAGIHSEHVHGLAQST